MTTRKLRGNKENLGEDIIIIDGYNFESQRRRVKLGYRKTRI